MSVLIKDMEMPTTCRDCRLSTFTDFDSVPFCNITMDDICFKDWETKRCDNCPLIPVPPHGRLGDLDKLENGLRHMAKYQRGDRQQGILGCCETIRLAPTIIPASKEE